MTTGRCRTVLRAALEVSEVIARGRGAGEGTAQARRVGNVHQLGTGACYCP